MAKGKSPRAKSASNPDGWTEDVVEGAAAAAASSKKAPSDIVHEVGGDDDELIFSSPVSDEETKGSRRVKPADAPERPLADSAETNSAEATEVEADEVVEGGAQNAATSTEEGADGVEASDISIEALIGDLERVTAEKDQYLDTSRRLQADFDNYRKRVAKDQSVAKVNAKESVISELFNVLDACDGALSNGAEEVEPIRAALLRALANQGLERIDPVDAAFDPERHEAVAHEPGEEGEPATVAEVMRPGYALGDRVIRPAMVRVRG